MATPAQAAANRANAQKSTGPKTPRGKAIAAANGRKSRGPKTDAGKARSRWNALKHGILAQSVIPTPLELYESTTQFSALHESLRAELAPATMMEDMLVETIAACYWRLGRVLRTEGASIASRQFAVQPDLEAQDRLDDLFEPPADRPPITRAPAPGTPHARSHRLAIMRNLRAVPDLPDAMTLVRYEAHFERQILRALAALTRLQRDRLGDTLQAPPSPEHSEEPP